MSITINPHVGGWNIDDLDGFDDNGYRVEIHEGSLVFVSPATMWHTEIGHRLRDVFKAQGRVATTEFGIAKTPSNVRVADVAVLARQPDTRKRAYWDPEIVSIAVEIVSPSSVQEDRSFKPMWYADAGIPEFWRVEEVPDSEDDAVIWMYALTSNVDGTAEYVQTAITSLVKLEAEAAQGSNL